VSTNRIPCWQTAVEFVDAAAGAVGEEDGRAALAGSSVLLIVPVWSGAATVGLNMARVSQRTGISFFSM
jgi:hypothetical protein